MTFWSLIIYLSLFCSFDLCFYIVAIIQVALVLGCHFLVPHRTVMTLRVQLAMMACLWHLVVPHYFINLAPDVLKAIAQWIATHYVSGECQAGHHHTVPIDGKARAPCIAIQALV